MIKLKRLSNQPILLPQKEHPWESAAVFNCAAIYDNGLIHMIYRATDIALNGKERPYVNCLGYAVSKDGIHFNCLEQPALSNDVTQEARGPEDPKIVKTGDTFGSTWNDFTYPLIVINTDNMKVLALGIAGFKGF